MSRQQLELEKFQKYDSYIKSNKDITDFLDSIYSKSHSKHSVISFRTSLKYLALFADHKYKTKIHDLISDIKKGKLDKFKILNELVVFLDKQEVKPSTIRTYLQGIRGFFRHCDIKIYEEDFRQSVRLPRRLRQREEPLTKEIIVRLLHVLPIKLSTAVLVACASGLRVGELAKLTIGDVDFESIPTRINVRASITKTGESRETYLTAEATRALKDYLNRFFGWKDGSRSNANFTKILIFGRTSLRDNGKEKKTIKSQISHSSKAVHEIPLAGYLYKHVQKLGELNVINESGKNSIHFHAFRKFFRTVVGDAVGRDYAEALMGHHFYLDTYYNSPTEKRRKMYLQAEPYLTISDFAKVEKDLEAVKEDYKDIQILFAKIMKYASTSGDNKIKEIIVGYNRKTNP